MLIDRKRTMGFISFTYTLRKTTTKTQWSFKEQVRAVGEEEGGM